MKDNYSNISVVWNLNHHTLYNLTTVSEIENVINNASNDYDSETVYSGVAIDNVL